MSHDYIALEWVKGEIEETLQQAQQALESYVENTQDRTRLKFCLSYLHQVHGTLQMVEFYGAALLAEEMEFLAKALAENTVTNESEALELLMRAILQLPTYLEHIKIGRRDLPVVLLPILNEIRTAYGENLISETLLFTPKIDEPVKLSESELNKFNDPNFSPWLKKLCQMEQTALLHILRNEQEELATEYLHKVYGRLYKSLGKTPQGNVWLPAVAFIECLKSQDLISDQDKSFLQQLNIQLKMLISDGISVLNIPVPAELLKNLLYIIAVSPLDNGAVGDVKVSFNLKDALPSKEEVTQHQAELAGPNKDTVGSVIRALIEEISALKEQFDLLVQSDDERTEVLQNLLPMFKRISDTVGVLGLGMPRRVLQEQEALVIQLVDQNEISDAELMDVAGALLYLEATLSSMQTEGTLEEILPEDASVSSAQKAVLHEARNVLEQVKDSVVEYIAKQWDATELDKTVGWLKSISGSINMIPLSRVAAILSSAADFVHEQLIVEQIKPQWSVMDSFADILTSVEYYIERYSQSPTEADESLLKRAELALSQLPNFTPEQIEETGEENESLDMNVEAIAVAIDGQNEFVVEALATDEKVSFAEEIEEAPESEIEVLTDEVSIEVDEISNDEIETLLEEVVDIEGAAGSNDVEEDDLIDDEIIEIFLEEAEEVLETLQEFWPLYRANHDDQESQSTVRRAFHTLKGSGRMVQAAVIGEFAWSIENMLNRVIDQTIQLSDNACHLIDHVITCIPELIEDFRERRTGQIDTAPLMAYADSLSQSEEVKDFLATGLNGVLEASSEIEVDQTSATLDAAISEDDIEGDTDEFVIEEILLDEVVIEPISTTENFVEVSDYENPNVIIDAINNAETVDNLEDENAFDEALIEIFCSEVASHLESVNQFIQQSQDEDHTNELSDQLQRALHTLKGSAHMAGITSIAVIASPLERLIKELRAYQVNNSRELTLLLTEGVDLIQIAINQLELGATAETDEGKLDSLLKNAIEIEHSQLASVRHGSSEQSLPDPQTLSQFLAKGMDVLIDADNILDEWAKNLSDTTSIAQLSSELEHVVISADKAELYEVSKLADALRDLYQQILENPVNTSIGESVIPSLLVAHESLLNMFDCLAAGQNIYADDDVLESINSAVSALIQNNELDAVEDIDQQVVEIQTLVEETDEKNATEISQYSQISVDDDVDAELLEIFLEEAQEIMESVGVAMQRWQTDPDNLRDVAELQRELHTLKGGARMAEISEVADLCHELESIYEGLHDGRVQLRDGLIPLLSQYHDILDDMLEHIRNGQKIELDSNLVTRIHAVARGADPLAVNQVDIDAATIEDIDLTESADENLVSLDIIPSDIDESDREILEIFLEEAKELQDELDTVLQDWQKEPENLKATEEIQRIMHTLKGGSRMAGLSEIGNQAHDFEAEMLKAQQGELNTNKAFFTDVFKRQDLLAAEIEQVSQSLSQPAESIKPEISEDQPENGEVVLETNVVPFTRGGVQVEEESKAVTVMTSVKNKGLTQLDQEALNKPQQGRRGPQEMVKVSAELLDGLVNLAGETSISRGRLEQQVTDFSHSLEEMDSTLERLRDQLRRLDIETQAQVLFRQERATPSYDDFDPLEMDRYSQMQQLARSLVESASDLLDIRESLTNKTRDAETLLLQQSRVNTELQEGLMQTRMVPFQRLVPRLRRIVRQVGQELDKAVEFKVYNADGEMDRTILERLISPLEHMLRNAVDHGIEDKSARSKTNKSVQGSVELRVSRDGGDVLVTLKDDGAGINIAAVRKKAIERGLMQENSGLSDTEVMQFILHAGFSTAQKVTQISGRGVGLDVVNSEIKQIGGRLFIDSIPGQGTEFQVRLPFTVSVNRALMVRVGDDLYAVPLESIQGIVRVPVDQLEEMYQQPVADRSFMYGEAEHRLEYLGAMLGTDAQPKLAGQKAAIPVLLIKGDIPYALQVDTLLGSREIVVKTLGPQFSSVMGVSGGTILGDGSVVIILDLPSMIRNQSNLEYQHARALDEFEAEKRHELEQQTKRILVVDDSVTVRKVTTRLLERNGFEVFTAKDGVEAIATLQDHIPDLMLLDIEMPRMDGFEVAQIVRHDSRLKDIPIIMITSRTGDKHRNRAFSIGVNEYLGKPFQEEILLENIGKFLTGDAEK
jgi:chemosensory pili system protein ChpA (sensor histidine kinase/response regulator)